MFVLATNFSKNEKKPFWKSYTLCIEKNKRYSYTILKMKSSKAINSKKVLELIGNMPVLLSNSIEKSVTKSFNFVNNTIYKKIVFEHGLKMLFSGKRFDKTVMLIDINGRYRRLADILLSHFKMLRVLTADVSFYEDYSAVKQNTCGAVVVVSKKLELSCEAAFIIAPDGIFFNTSSCIGVPVISISDEHNPDLMIKTLIHSFKVKASDCGLDIPDGFIAENYLAALYYHCGARESSLIVPQSVMINNCEESITNVKKPLII